LGRAGLRFNPARPNGLRHEAAQNQTEEKPMKWKEGTPQEQPPAGIHVARCIAVIDLGTHQHSYAGETWSSRDVRLGFELPNTLMKGAYKPELAGKPFGVNRKFRQSLHPKAGLRAFLQSWRGKAFDKDALDKFNPANLVGTPCHLTLIENGDYVDIDSVAPLGTAQCPPAVNKGVFFSLDPDLFKVEVYYLLGERTREIIAESPEWAALMVPANKGRAEEPAGGNRQDDDDIPF
jgi:hypothetical protein